MASIFKFKPFQAPYRFVFKDPDTGRDFLADSREKLFKQIIDYRAQNNLAPIQALQEVIEHYLCSLPENIGNCETIQLRRGWMQVLKGGIALIENLFYGEANMVSQDIADKRAHICASCPKNIFPDRDSFITWSDTLAVASTGGKESAKYDELGNCAVCSCPLRCKVWYKGDLKLSKKELTELPDFCWMINKELTNV